MPIPGNAEPGPFSGQQQVQQQPSINFSSSIPIKKRRFPIIWPSSPSPSPEEKIPGSEDHESKTKQESKIPDEKEPSPIDAKNTSSPVNSDASKTSALNVNKEGTPSNEESGEANVNVLPSQPQEAKPTVSLNPVADLGNKMDILSKEIKSSEPEVPESSTGSQTALVKQEIFSGQTEGTCGLELSTGSMNVELSLGPKEPLVPALEHKKAGSICQNRSDKSDPSLLSLALSEEKLVRLENSVCTTVGDVSSRVCSNRSNWDLNTTMDVWEGSTKSDAFAHSFADIAGFGKTDDEKSSLTTVENVGLGLNKGKRILDVYGSDSSNETIQPIQQCKIDDSLGLRLAMPHRELDAGMERFSLPDNLVSTSASPNLGLQQVQLLAMNVNRPVKSEPVDENCRRDCSVGSSSSSNMGLLKLSSVKTELFNNLSLETVLQSSVRPHKLVNCSKSMKSEVHQASCASSSSSLTVPLMPQSSWSRLPTCSELMTSGDLSRHLEHSFHNKELHDRSDIPGEQIASMVSKPASEGDKQLRPCNIGNSSVVHPDKHKLARVDEHTVELCQHGEEAADDDEKINVSAEMNEEESFESDFESQGNRAVDNSMDIGENMRGKEDEEYEEGEVREPIPHSAIEDPIDVAKNTENLEFVGCDSQNLQRSDLSGDQDFSAFDFDGKDSIEENHEKNDSNKDSISISCKPNSEENSLQKVSDTVLEVGVDEKRSVSVTPGTRLDLWGIKDIEETPGKEISSDRPTNVNSGIGVELEDAATDKVVNEICSGEDNSTLSKVEASLSGQDPAKDSGNKSRIINLSRASVVTSPCKARSIPNRLLTSGSGKERYSNLDGEMQPRRNREETYACGSNKFAKNRVHDQSLRNSRPSFMNGRGRISGRFGSLRSEWDSDHDFASETSYGPSDYRPIRRKHASSISDVEIECNGYDIQQDGNRRKATNEEFPSLRRASLRRLSPGDRDGPANRGNQTYRRFPRKMGPNGDKFMRHLSDDMVNPVYNHPQVMYDELDGQLERGNRNFSNMQRKGYPRIRSKSPVRSRTRSPGPWSSPRRRSPNALQDLPQHRSPGFYRTGRMRSPDRACFRDDMVARRRGSPSYVARHPNDLRDVDPGREHVHPRSSANSNRRSSPARVFQRNARRTDGLDSREMGDDDEYMNNGPLQSSKFHDERRKFVERRGPGPVRSFRPSYNSVDGENFRFHLNDGPRPYRFCPDADTEFVERGNMREREFDGHIKHQPLVQNRRNRNVEEQQDGNYRPDERVWHDDGFTDGRVKRRRF